MSVDAALDKMDKSFRAMLEPITPFRGTVVALSSGMVQILRESALSADTQLYARIAGFTLTVGDVVQCIKNNGQPMVLGKVQYSAAGTLGLDAGFIGEIVTTQTRTAASVTANTTSTSTWSVAITLDTTLPAGTWTCLPIYDVRVQHSAAGNADLRIVVNGSASATLAEGFPNTVPGASAHHSTRITGNVSDGSTPITVTGEFRSNTAGTTTPTGPRLVLWWQRTA